MKVGIIGAGYVGLPTGLGLAELGHKVICADNDVNKIKLLSGGNITFYEKGFEKPLFKNIKSGNISFTSSVRECVNKSDVVIIAVGTPILDSSLNMSDMNGIFEVIKQIAPILGRYKLIAVKSTVMPGTCDAVETLIKKINPDAEFDVVSLPEFLREGFAFEDFFNPDRIIAGAKNAKAKKIIKKLYAGLLKKTKIVFVNRQSAELIKYASNSFLALKIGFINELADFCEKTKADIREVASGIGLDKRIGPAFLNPGPGYGGSCFPKDTKSLKSMAKINGVEMPILNALIKSNDNRKKQIAFKILKNIKNIKKSKVAVLGLAFKAGTDDCRESPAVEIVHELLKHNVKISAYDPKCMDNFRKILGCKIEYSKNIYDAAKGADVVAVLTEWDEFKNINFKKLYSVMKSKNIVDARNIVNFEQALKYKFQYDCIGGKNA